MQLHEFWHIKHNVKSDFVVMFSDNVKKREALEKALFAMENNINSDFNHKLETNYSKKYDGTTREN